MAAKPVQTKPTQAIPPKAAPAPAPTAVPAPEPQPAEDLSRYTVGTPANIQAAAPKEKVLDGFGVKPSEKTKDGIPLEVKNRRLYYIGAVLGIVVLLATVAVLYFRFKQGPETGEEVVTQVEEIKEESVEIKTPSALAKGEISLEILNGSGIPGAASDNAKIFEELGYQIINTGNAEDTEGNQIYINPDLEGRLEALLEDVKAKLDIAEVSGDLSDSTASARIILGTPIQSSPSPAP